MPDFVLVCSVCGSEALWDTDQLPPAGTPEVGHPVLWPCPTCGSERRHRIQDVCLIAEKLRHAVSIATEIDRQTVDRVFAAAERFRQSADDSRGGMGAAEELAAVASAAGVPADLVDRIAIAEAGWLSRHGYLPERSAEQR
ncbi:MAG TPA: hypothetical protein VMD08_05385 [Candidatus Baltobacteraceae bacterium]|nr:hypothetical protein [Candidatus Baltobacteraceae bacterium]